AYTTIETRGTLTRPITTATGRVRAEGRVVNAGRKIVTAEVRVTDSQGRLLAHGGSTLLVIASG
ncbi:MAG TPA: hotdog domain-containing protein, partial [Burkholderiaceae bacterium]|nr:hotdog domain-containing protein [Burkholderiaceae bacterium]